MLVKRAILVRGFLYEYFANKAKIGLEALGEAVWFKMGEKEASTKKESLKSCLVERWGDSSVLVPEL